MSKKISKNAQRLLVAELARVECPWRPLRWREWHDTHLSQWIFHCRETGIRDQGIADGRTRKQTQRMRDELKGAGLLDSRGAITPAGKYQARSWSMPFSLSDYDDVLPRLRTAVKQNHYLFADLKDETPRIPEAKIAGACHGKQPARLQGLLIPLLCDEAVECRSDGMGYAFYSVADEHQAEEAIAGLFDEKQFIGELAEVYDESDSHYTRVMRASAAYQPVIHQFAIAAGVPLQSGCSRADPGGTAPLFPELSDDE